MKNPTAAVRNEQTGPSDYPVHAPFEERVGRTPRAAALICRGTQPRGANLDPYADRWARVLRGRGAGRNSLVARYVDHGGEMIVGLLGVLKSSGTCLPLDPHSPPIRGAAILRDARPVEVFAQRHRRGQLDAGPAPVVCLDVDTALPDASEIRTPAVRVTVLDAAYVIHASRTVGEPKGVVVDHANLVASTLVTAGLLRRARTFLPATHRHLRPFHRRNIGHADECGRADRARCRGVQEDAALGNEIAGSKPGTMCAGRARDWLGAVVGVEYGRV